jgi:hypothetical protein
MAIMGYWAAAWNDVTNNPGVVLEQVVRGPQDTNTIGMMAAAAFQQLVTRIVNDSGVEPCGPNLSDDCITLLGYVNFD